MLKPFNCVDHSKLWKILKEIGISDHLTCCLRNLHLDPEATVGTRHRTRDWFEIGRGVHQGCTLSPALLIELKCRYTMQNARLYESQAGIKIAGENRWPPGKSSMQSTSCETLGWMNHKLESRLPGEISTTLDMQMISL